MNKRNGKRNARSKKKNAATRTKLSHSWKNSSQPDRLSFNQTSTQSELFNTNHNISKHQ